MANDLSPIVADLVDLAAKNMGGEVIIASDDFFASKDNLIKDGRAVWDPTTFSDTGKVYDGWESRRNRTESNDWVIIKLARPGVISLIDVDTDHFLGNAPQFISVEGIMEHFDAKRINELDWQEIIPVSSVRSGRQNLFIIHNQQTFNFVRLQIFPDGGVARFRCYGRAHVPNTDDLTDYASLLNGGKAILASDMFFGEMNNLLKPYPPPNMGDGWETKRRRGKGHDWVIIELGKAIVPQEIEVDTTHFKGNYPDYCEIDVRSTNLPPNIIAYDDKWTTIISKFKLQGDSKHSISDFSIYEPITHIRLRIYPDQGVCMIEELNENEDLRTQLLACCGSENWADNLIKLLPFRDLNDLIEKSNFVWYNLSEKDWLEAFSKHPKIGDIESLRAKYTQHDTWSKQEQGSMREVVDEVLQKLKQYNLDYERKNGFIFIIFATGKSAEEMLQILETRLENSLSQELEIAAREQNKITRLRLERLVNSFN